MSSVAPSTGSTVRSRRHDARKGHRVSATLPLTLAITKALLVSSPAVADVIPLHFAQHILDAEEGVIVESAGIRRVKLDETYVSVLTMDEPSASQIAPAPRSAAVHRASRR